MLFSFRPTYITGKPFWCKSKSFFKAMGLVLSSLCLGIDLCMINLSVAPGHLHPEQWKAASAADASCMPPIIDYKRENQISHFVLQKGPPGRGFWGRSLLKCMLRLSCVMFLWALLRVCLLWEPLFVCLNFVVFGGGVGKRTRRRATPSSSPRRRRLRRMAWSQAQPTSSRSERGQLPATGASAEGSSSKPAQCVSPFNYCQHLSRQRLPETSQGIDTFAESASFYWLHPLTLETSGTSWLCTWCVCPLLPRGEAGILQASEIHGIPCLEKFCIYRSLV